LPDLNVLESGVLGLEMEIDAVKLPAMAIKISAASVS